MLLHSAEERKARSEVRTSPRGVLLLPFTGCFTGRFSHRLPSPPQAFEAFASRNQHELLGPAADGLPQDALAAALARKLFPLVFPRCQSPAVLILLCTALPDRAGRCVVSTATSFNLLSPQQAFDVGVLWRNGSSRGRVSDEPSPGVVPPTAAAFAPIVKARFLRLSPLAASACASMMHLSAALSLACSQI